MDETTIDITEKDNDSTTETTEDTSSESTTEETTDTSSDTNNEETENSENTSNTETTTTDEDSDTEETTSDEEDNSELEIEYPEEEVDESKNYQILIRVLERPDDDSLWVFYKETDEQGYSTIYSTYDHDEIDATVEYLINSTDGRYRSKDLLVVEVIPWTADAISVIMSNNLNLTDTESIDNAIDEIVTNVIDGNSENEESSTETTDEEEEEKSYYHIIEKVAQRPNQNSLWKFYKQKDSSGNSKVFYSSSYDEINAAVESMVNTTNGTYRSQDIQVLNVISWSVDATSEVMTNNIIMATEEDIDNIISDLSDEIFNDSNG